MTDDLCDDLLGLQLSQAVSVPTVKLNDGKDMPALALGTWLGYTVANNTHVCIFIDITHNYHSEYHFIQLHVKFYQK